MVRPSNWEKKSLPVTETRSINLLDPLLGSNVGRYKVDAGADPAGVSGPCPPPPFHKREREREKEKRERERGEKGKERRGRRKEKGEEGDRGGGGGRKGLASQAVASPQ